MEKVLVTGANGFVGRRLLTILADRYEVVATGRQDAPNSGDVCCYFEMDIVSKEAVEKVFSEVSPAVVIHCAALSKPDECELDREKAVLVNTTAVEYLLAAAARTKSYFVFLSTDFVFDGNTGMYTETDIPAPVNFYGETKVKAEELVKQYPFGWCIIRTVLVYGSSEGTRDNIVTAAAKALQKGEKLKIVSDQVRTPTYVDDLCTGIKLAIDKRSKGILHISGKDVLTPYEMVMETARLLNLDGSLVTSVTQDTFSQPARRPLKTGFNISKARRELGYEPLSFREGLVRTFNS